VPHWSFLFAAAEFEFTSASERPGLVIALAMLCARSHLSWGQIRALLRAFSAVHVPAVSQLGLTCRSRDAWFEGPGDEVVFTEADSGCGSPDRPGRPRRFR
jgi:hypothetical protein